MKSIPLVSIMIPTYNQATLLGKAIESALSQDYENLEVVVCDDNSTDNTEEVLSRYANHPQVRTHCNEKNLGRVKNYKHLLEDLAHGEWAVNLDGDDFFTDDSFISSSVSLATKYGTEVMFVQAGHSVQTAEGRLLYNALPKLEGEYKVADGKDYFLNFNHFSHLATMYRRSVAIDLDFYRYDIISADIESFLRLALNGKIILQKKIAGVWLHHSTNESKKLTIEAVDKNMLSFTAPAEYALTIQAFPADKIAKWKTSKLHSHLLTFLTIYFSNKRLLPGYLKHVLKKFRSPLLLLIIPFAFMKAMKKGA